jgi:hypothetical protein
MRTGDDELEGDAELLKLLARSLHDLKVGLRAEYDTDKPLRHDKPFLVLRLYME